MVLDILALVVLGILLALVIWLVVLLGNMPGNIARKRNHPQAQAISALGWIGIITLGTGWLVAIVWAYYVPEKQQANDDLSERITSLENQLQKIQAGGGES